MESKELFCPYCHHKLVFSKDYKGDYANSVCPECGHLPTSKQDCEIKISHNEHKKEE